MRAINVFIFIILSSLYLSCSYDNEPSLTTETSYNIDFKGLVQDYERTLKIKFGESVPIIKKGILGTGELEITTFRNKYGVSTISYLFSGEIEGYDNLQFRKFNVCLKKDLKSVTIENIKNAFICFIGNQLIIYDKSTGEFINFYVESEDEVVNKTPQLNTADCYSLIITTGNTLQSLRNDACECECQFCGGQGDPACSTISCSCSCPGDTCTATCSIGMTAVCNKNCGGGEF